MKIIIFFIGMLPFLLCGQTDTSRGTRFVNNLTWNEIKKRAEQEGKLIFIDCYATWCGPCKQMDEWVYPLPKVGSVINDKYISIKLQIDTSKNDNSIVKEWYAFAHSIKEEFSVTALPTYLFFSADGKILHRDLGYKYPAAFIRLLDVASDPHKQLYTLLQEYKVGVKNYAYMPYLIKSVKGLLKDNQLAAEISRDYIQNYLYKQNDDQLLISDNLYLIASSLQGTNEKGFNFFMKNADKINVINGLGFAERVLDYFIAKEEIEPKIYLKNKPVTEDPDWRSLSINIKEKYGKVFAERIILNQQIQYYQTKKDWQLLIKASMQKIEKYGLDTIGIAKTFTNNMIWDVFFVHSNDKKILAKAAGWSKIIHDSNPDYPAYTDTYANILYKLGKKEKALELEQKAIEAELVSRLKYKVPADSSYLETAAKMRQNLKTWD